MQRRMFFLTVHYNIKKTFYVVSNSTFLFQVFSLIFLHVYISFLFNLRRILNEQKKK